MKLNTYLLIDSHGKIEVRKNLPTPHLRQIAIRLSIQIDDSWFNRPVPTIELVVPNDHIQPMAVVQTEPLETGEG